LKFDHPLLAVFKKSMKQKKNFKQKKVLFLVVMGIAAFCVSFPLTSLAAAKNLSSRVKGRIILQTQKNGEAWYVDPSSGERSYLGKPNDAFGLMRKIGVGITDSDIAKIQVGDKNLLSASSTDSDADGLSDAIETALGTNINSADSDSDGADDKTEVLSGYNPNSASTVSLLDEKFAKKQTGKILLQVQKNGEAWYVYPGDNKRYFLGQAADAYKVMRELGLGISEKDIQNISESKTNKTVEKKENASDKNINKKSATAPEARMATGTVPQTAIDACNGLASRAVCSFIINDITTTGTCAEFNGQLSCRNENMGRKNGFQGNGRPDELGGPMASSSERMSPPNSKDDHGAPQEMIDACSGLTAGASCSFTGPNKNISTGTCSQVGDNLACRSSENHPAKNN
jgi:hypothetical protein